MPAYLVGEWTDGTSYWRGDTLTRGSAVYIDRDGRFAVVLAPSSVQISGVTSYDRATQRITVTLEDRHSALVLGPFQYDPQRKELLGGPVRENLIPMQRRRASVPSAISAKFGGALK